MFPQGKRKHEVVQASTKGVKSVMGGSDLLLLSAKYHIQYEVSDLYDSI